MDKVVKREVAVIHSPVCKIAQSVRFDPYCPYSGHKHCYECVKDADDLDYIIILCGIGYQTYVGTA